MTHKQRSFLLVLLMSMVTNVASAYDACIDGIYYNFSGTSATVTYKTSSYNSYTGNVVIPSSVTYNGSSYSVTSIGLSAFRDCSGLTSVTIPESVTSIGGSAFHGCSSLTSVTIPNSVTSIGNSAFYRCSGLTRAEFASIESLCAISFGSDSNPLSYAKYLYIGGEEVTDLVIPNSVSSIGNYAFSGCSGLTSVTIPNGVTFIGSSAFRYCSGLTSVAIPNSVTSIGSSVFYGCSGLTSVTIPNTVTSIGNYAFEACSGLASVAIPESVTSIGDNAFYRCSGLTSVTIPESVTSIGNSAFNSCSGLTSVTIPEGVTLIGRSAFEGSSLTSVTIPNTVTSIGRSAFAGCTGPLTVNCNIPNVSSSSDSPFYNSSFSSVTFGNGITSIGNYAFCNCSGLTSVTIGNSVTSIGSSAFSGCSGLTSVTIGNSVTSIGSSAFSGCSGLTSLEIPSTVQTIYDYAFSSCSGLTSISIPNSVSSIGDYAFSGCSGITSVTIGDKVTTIGSYAFSGCTGITSVNIKSNTIASKKYSTSSTLSAIFGNQVQRYIFEGQVQSIGQYACYGCSGLKYVTIGSSVTSIGNYAFNYCSNLSSVLVGNNVTSMGSNVFTEYDKFQTIFYFPNTPPSGWYATANTYVLNKSSYNTPSVSMNGAQIKEMISFTGDNTFPYTGHAPHIQWQSNLEDYEVTLEMPVLSGNVGEHVVDIPLTLRKGDEEIETQITYRYWITRATLTAHIENATREYGEANPEFSVSYSGFIGDDDESILTGVAATTTATMTSNVGIYSITLNKTQVANYDITCEPGTLTITKAPLSVRVADATRVYGNSNPTFTMSYEGLKNGESKPTWTTAPTLRTEATLSSGVGEYAITVTGGVAVNYELNTIIPGKLTITPASLTIKATNKFRTYYTENPALTYSCTGFKNNESTSSLATLPTLSTTATLTSDAGSYPIIVSGASSPNYTISYTEGTLTVNTRTLTASVGKYERKYGEENPPFEVTYSGFVEGQDESVLTTPPTASTTATPTSNVGSYTITVSGGSDNNYSFSYTNGTLVIGKASQTINWEQEFNSVVVGDQLELLAEATSGLDISYVYDTNIVSLYKAGGKTYLDCLAPGTFSIRATQTGNTNYEAAVKVAKTITVRENIAEILAELNNAIAQAQSLYDNSVEGSLVGQYAEGARAELLTAIEQATTVANAGNNSEAMVQSIADINEAIEIFESKKVTVAPNNFLSVNPFRISVGKNTTFSINLTNEAEIIMTDFYLQLPEGLSIAKDEDDYYDVTINGERTNRHVLEVDKNNEGLYHFLCYSNRNNALNGNEGELFSVKLECGEGVEVGTYQGVVKSIVMADIDRNNITQAQYTFTITVQDLAPGDVNGDGRINGLDIVEMVDHIMERPSEFFNFDAAELTGDGTVNGMDLVELVSLIMSQSSGFQNAPALIRGINGERQEGLTLTAENSGAITLGVEATDNFILAQCIVELSEGMTLQDVRTDGSHTVEWQELEDGRYMVLLYSTRNAILPSNKSLLTLSCTGEGNIWVTDALLVNENRQECWFANVALDNTTGINEMERMESGENEKLYDLAGRRVSSSLRHSSSSSLPKGVYIVNGKKVLVK